MSLLDSIKSPKDLRRLDAAALQPLAEEMRRLIVSTVNSNGGHMSSNLGAIELTIALHRVFESPQDAIVWDVGHQSYAHKILTGRASMFPGLRRKGGLSGFPRRSESEHDLFDTGHASTSISSALGLLEARIRNGESGKVIAVIGDGALTGGMAFEALSHAGQLGRPLVVVLNDNKMSISPNVGALARYLSGLSATVRYQRFRDRIDSSIRSIPRVGDHLLDLVVRAKRAVKAVLFKENLFADLGYEYVGPLDGHDIPAMTTAFRRAKKLKRPVVIHVVTRKGKGFDKAEEDPAAFHGVPPAFCADGTEIPRNITFTEVFGSTMMELAAEDRRVVAITAAMSKGTGLETMRKAFPGRVYDVGIAEQHAVTFAAGLAAGGDRPVVAIYSTFLQRAADQVFHDVALPNLPVIFAVDRAGLVGEDGETHQGIYDLAMFRCMPNMTILAPSDAFELNLFMRRALHIGGPVIIRYPKGPVPCGEDACHIDLERGRGISLRTREGSRSCVLALGPQALYAATASDFLAAEGLNFDVFSLRGAAPLDEAWLVGACASYECVAVIEEGTRSGGVGEAVAAILSVRAPGIPVYIRALGSVPPAQASRAELLADAGLDETGIRAFLRGLPPARDRNGPGGSQTRDRGAEKATIPVKAVAR